LLELLLSLNSSDSPQNTIEKEFQQLGQDFAIGQSLGAAVGL
jgi:hypothetical protein